MAEEGAATAERLAAEFLRLVEDGLDPNLEEFLGRVPDDVRQECRERIDDLDRLRGMLDEVGEERAAPEGATPEVTGFRIENRLGEGALGQVYSAWDETLQRRVALKVLHRGTDSVRDRILEEARKAAALQDPVIVTIHSITEDNAIVMEYVEGYPIDKAAAPLRYKQRARILHEVARALAVAHEKDIIHRDLKPQNILVTAELKPKILDFGLAISSDAGDAAHGEFAGTPLFASPEQTMGLKVAPASDVFSFGGVMFAVLTGEVPFPGKDIDEVLRKIGAEDPPFPRSIAPKVPEDLQHICLACLARDPAQRPTAAEVAADLGRYLAGEPARFRPALYRDTLQDRITQHTAELRGWEAQGMVSVEEADRLNAVYRRILADEDPWVFDARRISLPQVLLFASVWAVVVGASLLVWFTQDELPSVMRWALPAVFCVALIALGIRAERRREVMGAVAFLAAGALAVVPAVLAFAAELGVGEVEQPHVEQLFEGSALTNYRIFVASASALAVSVLGWWVLRLTAFAWTTAVLAASTYCGVLLTQNVLDLELYEAALCLLPLVLLEIPALLCESRGKPRWALPFDLVALVTLVFALDVMALDGGTFELLGLEDLFSGERAGYLGFTLNGLILLLVTIPMERARSLDLRRGARLLQLLIPIHLLASLYFNAEENQTWGDIALYLGAVVLLLLLGPWRSRHWFLTGGLGGVAFGSYLLLELGKVDASVFTFALCSVGLIGAVVTYTYLLRRSR